MLAGTVVGIPVGLATHAAVIGVLAVLGLLIGTVIAYAGKNSSINGPKSHDESRESRLRELEDLRSQSLISEEEYESKRKEILSDL